MKAESEIDMKQQRRIIISPFLAGRAEKQADKKFPLKTSCIFVYSSFSLFPSERAKTKIIVKKKPARYEQYFFLQPIVLSSLLYAFDYTFIIVSRVFIALYLKVSHIYSVALVMHAAYDSLDSFSFLKFVVRCY